MEWESTSAEDLEEALQGGGLFILSEGNFQYGNASLAYYRPDLYRVEREVFRRANGMKLGDVAQSMVMHDGTAWIVVNNSHVLFAIDPETGCEKGRITGLTSPRYMHFVSATKAYVTQLWDNRIFIVNPETCTVTGFITCPDMEMESGSTEQMVALGDYVYVNCWSYQNRLLKIDSRTDSVVEELRVGIQPSCLAADCFGKLWTITDGGYDGSSYGNESPALCRINPDRFTVEQRWYFNRDDSPGALRTNSAGDTLYWINGGVWKMAASDASLPDKPFLPDRQTRFYALGIAPESGEIYVGDALDCQQTGIIYRHAADGSLIDSCYAGVMPGFFCWKRP